MVVPTYSMMIFTMFTQTVDGELEKIKLTQHMAKTILYCFRRVEVLYINH